MTVFSTFHMTQRLENITGLVSLREGIDSPGFLAVRRRILRRIYSRLQAQTVPGNAEIPDRSSRQHSSWKQEAF